MQSKRHKNGDISIRLSDTEAQMLWCMVREGRAIIAEESGDYDSGLALALLGIGGLQGNGTNITNAHVRRFRDDVFKTYTASLGGRELGPVHARSRREARMAAFNRFRTQIAVADFYNIMVVIYNA